MKAPLSWLNEFVEIDIPLDELAKVLLNAGFELESITSVRGKVQGIKAALIVDIKPHFQADNLSVCLVDAGGDLLTVVTGAKNIEVKDFVPLATVGSVLADGTVIKESQIRGVYSYGMMCSGEELGINDSVIMGAKNDGILILQKGDLEDEEIACGDDVVELLGLDDYILDISIPSNRPDCASIFGLAREISALLNKRLKAPSIKYNTSEVELPIAVDIKNAKNCPRYMAACVRNAKIVTSPREIRMRLWLCGHSPINSYVDITNYVLLEMGQPMHAFDYKNIKGSEIIVRDAIKGEKMTALNDKNYDLGDSMLVIADCIEPVAIAGVMGGKFSAIGEGTTDVVFEAAKFARGSVRSTSRQLNLRSDSSARFEKGVDVSQVPDALARALSLVSKYKLGKICPVIVDELKEEVAKREISAEISKINALLGISIKQAEIVRILRGLRFECEVKNSVLEVVVPPYREDIENYADLAEEIIRCLGYENLASTPIVDASIRAAIVNDAYKKESKVRFLRQTLVGQGANEIYTYSMVDKAFEKKMRYQKPLDLVVINNPISEKMDVMRTNLTHNMLECISLNMSKKNNSLFLYEIGKVYEKDAKNPTEKLALSIASIGQGKSFYDFKSIIDYIAEQFSLTVSYKRRVFPYLHDGISAEILLGDECIGHIGVVHPLCAKNYDISGEVLIAEILLDDIFMKDLGKVKYQPIARFPYSVRDLAVTIDKDMAVGALVDRLKASNSLVKSVEIFDIYTGDQIEQGKKSVAFSIVLGCNDRTLKDEEINAAMGDALRGLEQDFGAKIRS